MKIWTQWNNLSLPQGITHLETDGFIPAESQFDEIEFYCPSYMGGIKTLEIIPRMKNLKTVHYSQAGYEDILPHIPEGVVLCNGSGLHDVSTSELAIGLTIASRRGFAEFMDNQKKGIWKRTRQPALADSHVGIVGYGHIGKHIASLLSHFETKITAFTRSGSDGAVKISEFDDYLPQLDVIILILPLTKDSKHFMNADRFKKMKDGATLINVARGAIVDTDALVAELHTGRITAGLDVTDPEPLPEGHPLWSAPNLIITPHVGGDSGAFDPRARKMVQEQLSRLVENKPLRNQITGLN
ncbi:MAG: dihydrofolate reductase [Actinobacteria bacterium]|nr:dihydrofolate reductase [Actinomycetota bacterium]